MFMEDLTLDDQEISVSALSDAFLEDTAAMALLKARNREIIENNGATLEHSISMAL